MKAKARGVFTFVWTSVFLFGSPPVTVEAQSTSKVSVVEAQQIAVDAYIYGYSLITTNVTRVQMTNVPADEAFQGPVNRLKYSDDGSLTLYLQNEYPGKDQEANWLPAPKGAFVLMLRMDWPKATPPSIIDVT